VLEETVSFAFENAHLIIEISFSRENNSRLAPLSDLTILLLLLLEIETISMPQTYARRTGPTAYFISLVRSSRPYPNVIVAAVRLLLLAAKGDKQTREDEMGSSAQSCVAVVLE